MQSTHLYLNQTQQKNRTDWKVCPGGETHWPCDTKGWGHGCYPDCDWPRRRRMKRFAEQAGGSRLGANLRGEGGGALKAILFFGKTWCLDKAADTSYHESWSPGRRNGGQSQLWRTVKTHATSSQARRVNTEECVRATRRKMFISAGTQKHSKQRCEGSTWDMSGNTAVETWPCHLVREGEAGKDADCSCADGQGSAFPKGWQLICGCRLRVHLQIALSTNTQCGGEFTTWLTIRHSNNLWQTNHFIITLICCQKETLKKNIASYSGKILLTELMSADLFFL